MKGTNYLVKSLSKKRIVTLPIPTTQGIGVDPERGWRKAVDDLLEYVSLS